MIESKVGQELHAWLQDAAMAEEFFFATIARIDQKVYQETGAVVQGLCEEIKWLLEWNASKTDNQVVPSH